MNNTLGVVMVYMGNAELTTEAIETLARTTKNFFITHLFLFQNGPMTDGIDMDEDYLNSLNSDVFKICHIKFPINVGIIKPRNVVCEIVAKHKFDYCLVCDNDVIFGDGWPVICREAMNTHDMIGSGVARLDFSMGRDWFNYCLHYTMPRLNIFYDTAYSSTSFMFMKTEILLSGAQFDPYWIHRWGFDDVECHGGACEDIDFCLQARQYGFRIAGGHVPQVHCPSSGRILYDNAGRLNEHNQETVSKIFYKRWKDLEFN